VGTENASIPDAELYKHEHNSIRLV
jgi:hypothetical protein